MEIDNPIGIAGNPVKATSVASATGLANDFDEFLLLLTTQLQNQDPLSPMDTNEFTSQLVQFASVEQQINQNQNLESLVDLSKINRATSAVAFLGNRIEAQGATSVLADGAAEWTYILTEPAATVALTVTDDSGEVVFRTDGQSTFGQHGFVWDGRDATGQLLPDGHYTLSVAATGLDDESLSTSIGFVGRVTGLETVNDELVLSVDGITVPIEQVLKVRESLQSQGQISQTSGAET
ncbi:MAG: flagellar hook capping FlgD N-terminal domain-containing protein [Alphaproteobacteria bacterium]|jgi:flagellar basal-body rod modification protein FlgD|nr:flagellar hook capping FlgD N-terminal domain-containing protein [Alphaproteobacteria bacterium]MDP6516218.1 flagellar hook capping FlgD N-terminal domain-containing protein [Alphaproteobacteria bacterium]